MCFPIIHYNRFNLLLQTTLLNQTFGQRFLLAVGNHPTDDVAAENIHGHVQIEISPFSWPLEL